MPSIRRDTHDDPVRKHRRAAGDRRAVATRFPNDWGRFARDRALVDRCGAHDDLAICGYLLACGHEEQVFLLEGGRIHFLGVDEGEPRGILFVGPLRKKPLVELVGRNVALGGAQGIGLCLAAPFGQRFREVGEQHGQPQDDRNGQDEAGLLIGNAHKGEQEQDRSHDGGNEHHEHDRVLRLVLRFKFQKRILHSPLGEHFGIVFVHNSRCHLSSHLLPKAPSGAARR